MSGETTTTTPPKDADTDGGGEKGELVINTAPSLASRLNQRADLLRRIFSFHKTRNPKQYINTRIKCDRKIMDSRYFSLVLCFERFFWKNQQIFPLLLVKLFFKRFRLSASKDSGTLRPSHTIVCIVLNKLNL